MEFGGSSAVITPCSGFLTNKRTTDWAVVRLIQDALHRWLGARQVHLNVNAMTSHVSILNMVFPDAVDLVISTCQFISLLAQVRKTQRDGKIKKNVASESERSLHNSVMQAGIFSKLAFPLTFLYPCIKHNNSMFPWLQVQFWAVTWNNSHYPHWNHVRYSIARGFPSVRGNQN